MQMDEGRGEMYLTEKNQEQLGTSLGKKNHGVIRKILGATKNSFNRKFLLVKSGLWARH